MSTILSDDELQLTRYQHATDESLDRAPDWMFKAMEKHSNDNTARPAISAANPLLLAEQDPARVARAKAMSLAAKPAMTPITNLKLIGILFHIQWLAWAKQVFPDKKMMKL